MYREAYNHIENKLHGHQSALYGAPDSNKGKHGVFEEADQLLKWTVRSIVKGVIYMTPAVPFFSVFRTSQSKYKGVFISPEEDGVEASLVSFWSEHSLGDDALHAHELRRTDKANGFSSATSTFLDRYSDGMHGWKKTGYSLNPLGKPFHPYQQSDSLAGRAFENLGAAQNRVRSWFNDRPLFLRDRKTFWGSILTKHTADRYINAAFSYTPYMYAKGESALWVDNGKTDMAIERMVDGLDKMDVKEFKAGANEVWRAVWHKPFKDPVRNAEGERRHAIDTSVADDVTKEQINQIRHRQKTGHKLQPWQQHLINRPGSQTTIHHPDRAAETDKAGVTGNQQPWQERVVSARPAVKEKEQNSSHAEQEAMRKALEALQPPTNSIH